MSRFTTEVRYICETIAGYDESQGYGKVEEILEEAAPEIFEDFPIFDETYRLPLEVKILRHYYTREISEETVALWKFRLNDMMNLIMPYYNKLYESDLLKFNPFYDVDLTRDYTRDDTGATADLSSEDTNEIKNRNVNEIGVVNENERGAETHLGNESITENEIESNENIVDNKSSNNTLSSELSGVTETRNGTTQTNGFQGNTSTRNSNSDSDNWDLYNDTPQGGVDGLGALGMTAGSMGTGYLTDARHIMNSETNNSGEVNATEVSNSTQEAGTNISEGNKASSGSEESVSSGSTSGVRSLGGNKVISRDNGRNIDKDNTRQNANSTVEDSDNKIKSERSSQGMISNLSQYIEHVIGKQGTASYSKMLMEFRDTFLNIDRMIIKDLSPLFFGLWE